MHSDAQILDIRLQAGLQLQLMESMSHVAEEQVEFSTAHLDTVDIELAVGQARGIREFLNDLEHT